MNRTTYITAPKLDRKPVKSEFTWSESDNHFMCVKGPIRMHVYKEHLDGKCSLVFDFDIKDSMLHVCKYGKTSLQIGVYPKPITARLAAQKIYTKMEKSFGQAK